MKRESNSHAVPTVSQGVSPSGQSLGATPDRGEGDALISSDHGWKFIMGEIAERNPLVRHALKRRAEG